MGELKYSEIKVEGYERVVEIKNNDLHALIAIHNTKLGPALGGIRAYPYLSFDAALRDVLRLAKGMTYKAAITETGTGGGKSVIFTDYRAPKSEKMLLDFAEAVNYFAGQYICAEDFGMGLEDLRIVCQGTKYAVGLPKPKSSGDPSRFTAYGGFRGLQAVCKKLWGSDSVAGRTFAVQGLGSVGMRIANHLFWGGAHLIVADVNRNLVDKAVSEFGAKAVSTDEITKVKCDVLVPCALGAVINPESLPLLRCQAVAGLANNQLFSDAEGEALYQKGILYAPDYVINSGGLLAVCVELEYEGFNPNTAKTQADRIYDLLGTIFTLADDRKQSTNQVARELADYNIEHGIGKRTKEPFFH